MHCTLAFLHRRQTVWHRARAGFTLVEVMVAVAVLAVLATLAAPSFNDAILSNKLTGYSNSFVASAQLARSEAIKRNRTVKLCMSADGATCAAAGGWQQGWIVQFVDVDGVTKVAQYQQALDPDFRFSAAVASIDFPSVGVGATSATLVLCRATAAAGSQAREITVGTSGNASAKKTTAATCA